MTISSTVAICIILAGLPLCLIGFVSISFFCWKRFVEWAGCNSARQEIEREKECSLRERSAILSSIHALRSAEMTALVATISNLAASGQKVPHQEATFDQNQIQLPAEFQAPFGLILDAEVNNGRQSFFKRLFRRS